MSTEQFSNNATTTLNGGIDNVTTSLVVTSAALFPSSPQFRIMVDSEIMLVTAVAGTTFTVTRAAEGTVAAAHLSGATVSQILTAGALNQLKTDTLASILTSSTASLSSDITTAIAPSFTSLVSTTVSGSTKYLVLGSISGVGNGSMTLWARIQTDNVTVNGQGTFSDGTPGSGSGIECKIMFIASGLSTGSHTFTLQAGGSPTSATIHAGTNATQENATIIVIPIN